MHSEFCGHQNDKIPLTVAPTGNAMKYEIEPAPKAEDDDEDKPDNEAEAAKGGKTKVAPVSQRSNLIIFVVDISGSMNITTEVPQLQGTLILKLLLKIIFWILAEWTSAAGRGGGNRHISRLECLKEAISRHMDHLAATEPNNKVTLVTFDNKVLIG